MAEDQDRERSTQEFCALMKASFGEAWLDADLRPPEVFAFVQELQRLVLSADAWSYGRFVASQPPIDGAVLRCALAVLQAGDELAERISRSSLSESQQRFLLAFCSFFFGGPAAALPLAAMADLFALCAALHSSTPSSHDDTGAVWQACLEHLERTENEYAQLWISLTVNLSLCGM